MSDPWFDPNLYGWIPGTALGVVGGLMGALGGTLAPRGKAKGLVLGAWCLFIVASVALLGISIAAYLSGQPYGVWYGLGLPGVIGIILFPTLLPVILHRYREAEHRRMSATDLNS